MTMTCCEFVDVENRIFCRAPVSDEVWATQAMGCGVMCEAHFLAYHKAASVAEVAQREEAKRREVLKCAVCGRLASWVAGAGQARCPRHADDY